MEPLAYRKNAVMVREAVEPGRPLPAVKGASAATRSPTTKRGISLALARRSEFCYRLFWMSFQFCGLEAALGKSSSFAPAATCR
jgi:hypothetical protein